MSLGVQVCDCKYHFQKQYHGIKASLSFQPNNVPVIHDYCEISPTAPASNLLERPTKLHITGIKQSLYIILYVKICLQEKWLIKVVWYQDQKTRIGHCIAGLLEAYDSIKTVLTNRQMAWSVTLLEGISNFQCASDIFPLQWVSTTSNFRNSSKIELTPHMNYKPTLKIQSYQHCQIWHGVLPQC